MSQRRRERFRGRRDNGTFFRIPTAVLDSPNYIGLSLKARALLLDMGAQFRGHNNGDSSIAWSWASKRGWRSKDTLRRAMLELLAAGMIQQTRQGSMHWPSLFAFSWIEIHECDGKLDVPSTATPSNAWRKPPVGPSA